MSYEDQVHKALTMPAISIENSNECPEIKVYKSRRNNVQNLATMMGIAAMVAPGFMGTAEAMMGSPYKPPTRRRELGPLEYGDWEEANYEELKIAAAESGSDREVSFDFYYFAEQRYEEYVEDYWRDNPLSETFKKAEEKRQRRLERNKRNRP